MRFVTASGSILDPALLSVDPAGHSEDVAAQQAYLAALTQPSSEPEQQPEAAYPAALAQPSLEPEQQQQQPEEAVQGADAEGTTAPAESSDGLPKEPALQRSVKSERDGDAASQHADIPSAAVEDGHSSQAESSQLLLAPAAERDRRRSEPGAVRCSARKRRPVRFNHGVDVLSSHRIVGK